MSAFGSPRSIMIKKLQGSKPEADKSKNESVYPKEIIHKTKILSLVIKDDSRRLQGYQILL